MKNSMSLAYKLAATTVLAVASNSASATCGSTQTISEPGKPPVTVFVPGTCPPPTTTPIPSPTPTTGTVNNGGNAASQAAASANNKTDVKTDVKATGGNAAATAAGGKAESNSSAKTGDVNVDGSNNSQYSSSTTYKAAAASAISGGAGNMGHGCFRGKGGFSLGLQTVAGGASVTIGGGEEYEISKIKTIDAQGNEVEIEGNLCAIDQINQSTIAAGATPYATNGQIRLGALTAAKASPDVGRAMAEIATVSTLFDRQATGGASAPVSNTYQTVIVDKAGVTTTIECPKGTKPVLNKNGVPVVDKSTGEPVCQPG